MKLKVASAHWNDGPFQIQITRFKACFNSFIKFFECIISISAHNSNRQPAHRKCHSFLEWNERCICLYFIDSFKHDFFFAVIRNDDDDEEKKMNYFYVKDTWDNRDIFESNHNSRTFSILQSHSVENRACQPESNLTQKPYPYPGVGGNKHSSTAYGIII